MKNTAVIYCTMFIIFAALGAQGEPSVRLPLPEQLAKGTLPQFSARDRTGEALFQNRHLQKSVEQETKRIALVYFATWCMPCAKGAAMIRDARSALKQNGVQVFFVNAGEKEVESVYEWIRKYGDPEAPLIMDVRSQMTGPFGLLEPNGSLIMPKVLVLDKKLTPLFLLGTEGDDFPEILWGLGR